MLDPGLHALKGTNPLVAVKLWKDYALPRSLYGIETLKFSKSDIQKLELLQLKICRQIQGLPDRTTNAATYALLGIETIEATVDKLMLSFFGNIIQNGSSIEFRITERQQVMSTQHKNAFATRIRNILEKYNLPTIITLMESVPPKEIWKRMVKNAVEFYWKQTREQERVTKSTMEFFDDNRQLRKPHPVWALVPNNTMEVKKAGVKCRLLTRTYTLQADRTKLSRGRESDMCNLCKISHEDTRRFFLECSYLEDDREKHLSKLKQYTRTHLSENTFDRLKSENLLLQFILDPSHTKCCDVVGRIIKEHLYDLEHITRTICYGLHTKRSLNSG